MWKAKVEYQHKGIKHTSYIQAETLMEVCHEVEDYGESCLISVNITKEG